MRLLLAEPEREGIEKTGEDADQIMMELFDRKSAGVSVSEKELTQICSITYLLR